MASSPAEKNPPDGKWRIARFLDYLLSLPIARLIYNEEVNNIRLDGSRVNHQVPLNLAGTGAVTNDVQSMMPQFGRTNFSPVIICKPRGLQIGLRISVHYE